MSQFVSICVTQLICEGNLGCSVVIEIDPRLSPSLSIFFDESLFRESLFTRQSVLQSDESQTIFKCREMSSILFMKLICSARDKNWNVLASQARTLIDMSTERKFYFEKLMVLSASQNNGPIASNHTPIKLSTSQTLQPKAQIKPEEGQGGVKEISTLPSWRIALDLANKRKQAAESSVISHEKSLTRSEFTDKISSKLSEETHKTLNSMNNLTNRPATSSHAIMSILNSRRNLASSSLNSNESLDKHDILKVNKMQSNKTTLQNNIPVAEIISQPHVSISPLSKSKVEENDRSAVLKSQPKVLGSYFGLHEPEKNNDSKNDFKNSINDNKALIRTPSDIDSDATQNKSNETVECANIGHKNSTSNSETKISDVDKFPINPVKLDNSSSLLNLSDKRDASIHNFNPLL